MIQCIFVRLHIFIKHNPHESHHFYHLTYHNYLYKTHNLLQNLSVLSKYLSSWKYKMKTVTHIRIPTPYHHHHNHYHSYPCHNEHQHHVLNIYLVYIVTTNRTEDNTWQRFVFLTEKFINAWHSSGIISVYPLNICEAIYAHLINAIKGHQRYYEETH